MRKFIVIIAMAVLSASALSARELTAEQAWNRVAGARHTAQKMRSVTSVTPRLVKTVNTDTNQLAYYIFNTGDCTVFASANDIAAPVLGYTESELTDMNQIPPAMVYLLNTYVRQIEWARAEGIQTAYEKSRSNGRPEIEPLVTTKWNQDSPYNDLCPLKNGDITYTGCVATAMAQAMGYYRYPAVGHGVVSYTWNKQTLSVDLSESPIHWDDILPTYTETEPGSASQRVAIASLMRDCGYALHMTYGTAADGGSMALTYDIPGILADNYDYDKGVRNERHAFYSQTDWEQMIYDELAASRPVVYAGRGDGGGHAFICDGYQGDGLFHINWGWGGKSDGYFALTALDPGALGAGGGTGGFNQWQQAVVGIQRPRAGSLAPVPYIGSITNIYGDAVDYRLRIQTADDMTISGAFRNLGRMEAAFTFGVKLVSDEDGETIYLTDNRQIDQTYAQDKGPAYIEVTVPSHYRGDYKAYPVYKLDGGDWQDVRLPYGGRQYIRLSVTPSRVEIYPEDSSGILTLVSCSFPSAFVIDQEYSVDLVIHNLTDEPQPYSCNAQIMEDANSTFQLADLGDADGVLEPQATAAVSIKGKLEYVRELTPGEYILQINGLTKKAFNYPVTVTDISSGISNVTTDVDHSDIQIYDLSGRLVNTKDPAPGVYIKVIGNAREKILIK